MKKTLIATLIALSASTAHAATIKLDGSSTVFPISEAVAEEFQKATKEQVTVGISGTGGGFKKFCRGETDISNASRPIQTKEMEACKQANIKYIEVPIAFDALTVVVHPSNPLSAVTVEQLKKMWSPEAANAIKNWNQVDPSWADKKLSLYGPGADSGTFDYFTEAVVGKAKSSRGDYTASEDDNTLVTGVVRDPGGLAYFGYAYYVENKTKLKALAIKQPDGKTVLPSEQSVMDGTYVPLSRPIFIYINAAALDKPEVKAFVDFYLKNVPALSKEVKYIPLTPADYEHAKKIVAAKRTGTAFGGHSEVGVKISDLLKREPKE